MRDSDVAGENPDPRALGEQFLKSLDKTQLGAAASKLFAANIGDLVLLLSRSPAHKHHSLADIEWMVLPPVAARQFYVVEASHKERGLRAPVALVTWALVSQEVDARLREGAGQRVRLRPDEWKSGEVAWIIDVIGSNAGVLAALRWVLAGPLKQRSVKAVLRDTSGAPVIKTLDPDAIGATNAAAAQ